MTDKKQAEAERDADASGGGRLWRSPGFLKLWAGQTVSDFGSLVTAVALPFAAVLVLRASPFQMALLRLSGLIPALVMALVAGVWVDRLRRRPILIGADLGRALLLGSIPAAAAAGVLTIEHLYAVVFLAAIMGIFFDVAYRSYLPSIVRAEDLVEANSKLSATSSMAEVAAFSIAGWLVQVLTAPVTILIDAVSFLISALSLSLIRESEAAVRPRESRAGMGREIAEGAQVVLRDPVLRALTISAAISAFSGALFGTQYALYALDELGFKPGMLGVIYAIGGISSLLGALAAGRVVSRLGAGRSMALGIAVVGVGELMLPIARGASVSAAALMIAQQLSDGGFVIYAINQTSIKQAIAPAAVLGRVNASLRFAILASAIGGTLVSGLTGQAFGLRATMTAGGLGTILAAWWLLRSAEVRAIADPGALVPIFVEAQAASIAE